MDSDFQLFSPREPPRRDELEDKPSQPCSDISTQDWSQWMRWDEPDVTDSSLGSHMKRSQGMSFASPDTTISTPSLIHNHDFSPQLPLGLVEIPSHPNNALNAGSSTLHPSPPTGHPRQTGLVSPISSVGMSQKRKTGSGDHAPTTSSLVQNGKKVPTKKRAHNVIEKRYRANLNEKIAELRDSVPSLRALKSPNADPNDDDENDGPQSNNKLNKSSILSKATEYIKHLEIRNQRLEDENTALKNRLRHVDKAADQAVTSSASVSSPSNYTASDDCNPGTSPSIFSNPEDVISEGPPSKTSPPEGLIKAPDSWKRMRAEAAQSGAFTESYIKSTPRNTTAEGERSRRRSRFPNKYMLGALAGLMVLEGLGSDKTETEEKGLLAIPFNLIGRLQSPSLAHLEYYLHTFWSSWHARVISHFLLLATLVVGSAFLVFVYLFNAQPTTQRTNVKLVEGKAAPLTSSDFRRQAWLTSMQRVGVPRHRFFREWYVVTSRCFEYVLRCLMGWKLYSWATGITEEDEKGRVKTWDIAIDAQLTGGDAEISKSRLVLTIFAAGTLPRSPMRMMLKALHVHILLGRVGAPGSWTFHMSNDIARALARYQWAAARGINAALPDGHPDRLPSHLDALIRLDCEDVLIDTIVQRAVNLTWNRPTQEGTDEEEVLLDIVEEDPAIQCSVDALAAWLSSHLLQDALLKYIEASAGDSVSKESRDVFKEKIRSALDVAPRLSAAYTRALVMKAVFFNQGRVQNIDAVLAALPRDEKKGGNNHVANFLDSSLPITVREEVSIAVRCAMIAAIVTSIEDGSNSLPPTFTVQKAMNWFNQLPTDPVDLSLISFSAVYHLLHLMASDIDFIAFSDSSGVSTPITEHTSAADDEVDGASKTSRSGALCPREIPNLGRVAAELIHWARDAYNPFFYGSPSSLVDVIVKSCTDLCANAGIDVVEYLQKAPKPLPSRKRRPRRRRGVSQQSLPGDPDPDPTGSCLTKPSPRQRSASNDTGCVIVGLAEDELLTPKVPDKVDEIST